MSGVRCHVSHVRCHVSGVTCHMYFFFYKLVGLVGGGSVINGSYPVQFFRVLGVNRLPNKSVKNVNCKGAVEGRLTIHSILLGIIPVPTNDESTLVGGPAH